MKAKDKAVELVDKHIDIMPCLLDQTAYTIKNYAKQLALMEVDEIMANQPFRDYGFKFDSVSSRLDAVEQFFKQVKTEIEKL